MADIFISYRRDDASGYAGRLHDGLVAHFGAESIFLDVEVEPGLNYVTRVREAIAACHAFIAVVGPRWATIADERGPRLHNETDLLRIEVEEALARPGLRVIPLLLPRARMPEPADVPATVAPLMWLQAIEFSDARWSSDLQRLISVLEATITRSIADRRTDALDPTLAGPEPTSPDVTSFPSELIWVSKRLTRDLVRLDAAKRKYQRPSADDDVPEPETLEDYAVRAAQIALRETGSLLSPKGHSYLRFTLDCHLATFEVPFIWETPDQQSVATLFADQRVDGVRVFVGLFGSSHNVPSRMEREKYVGRTPSDVDGLHQILQDTRDPGEVRISSDYLNSPRERDYTDGERADLAASLVYGIRGPAPARPLDVLAKPYFIVTDHELDAGPRGTSGHYDLVVIGTAIWAGTPAKLDEPARPWREFDALVFESADRMRRGEGVTVPAEVMSVDAATFAGWFVDVGRRAGKNPSPLMALRRPHRLDPRRYLDRSWTSRSDPQSTGVEGFVLTVGDDAVLVAESGAVYPVHAMDGLTLYRPDHEKKWLEPGEAPHSLGPESREATSIAMWIQAADWRRRPLAAG